MRLAKKTRRLIMTGVAAASMTGMGVAAIGAVPASAADKLPAYTSGFCVTRTLNVGQPSIKGKRCTGYYKVTRATYQFSEDNLHVCPRMGIYVHLDEAWISPPTGGAPTILASYHAYL
ncbi:MAG: hypothetical protein ABSF03_05735 [Streptosporangiaceae bacterium]|jgi:hypothetical protein